eukprot:1159873-Pelagomonas_calceolata.AAC.3
MTVGTAWALELYGTSKKGAALECVCASCSCASAAAVSTGAESIARGRVLSVGRAPRAGVPQ